MGEPAAVVDREDVVAVPGQRRARDDLLPAGELLRRRVALAAARLDAGLRREVPGEEARVHVDRSDDARGAEPDDGPVVAGRLPAPGLPAVDDLAAGTVVPGLERRRGGGQQVLLLAERLVAGRDHAAAEPPRGQVRLRRHRRSWDSGQPVIGFGSGGA